MDTSLTPEPEAGQLVEPWTVLESAYLQRSRWRDIRVDRVRIHTGEEIGYSYCETPEAVFVVPLTSDGQIVVVRQYRHPLRAWIWEIPAGALEGEPLEVGARRELAEEIGGSCGELVPLGWFYSSPNHLRSRNHAVLALDVELGPPNLGPTELLQVVLLDPAEAFARARDGGISDGQSALALLRAESRVREHLADRAPRRRS